MGTIKEFLTAYYDTEKGKIVGAQPNSLVYFHEEGHQRQYKRGIGQRVLIYVTICLMVSVAILVKRNFYAKIWFFLALLLIMYLELDAWAYAFKKVRKIKLRRM